MIRYEKSKSEQRKKIPIGSNITNSKFRLKMIQPRTTSPYHKTFQRILLRLKPFAEVSDIFWLSIFSCFVMATLERILSSPLLGV